MNARAQALELILRWQRSPRMADELLETVTEERALTMELFYGWLRNRLALEFIRSRFAAKPPRPVVAALIELGLYQLHFLKLPPHAAVHETVEVAKQRVSAAEARFVNAVLRQADAAVLEAAPPWIRLSHPQWLWERWVNQFGLQQTEALCRWNNEPPPLYVRGREPWPGVLEPSGFHPCCFRVTDAAKFFANPGSYYVQDPSTLLAVDVLDPQPGELVLDLCAAPGGKTTYMAEKMHNRGRIIAADSSARRLALVVQNCRRLGLTMVSPVACAAGGCLRGGRFDRVLVDAPCSNTGVLRRRPDLRWRLSEAEIARLARVQRELLAAAAKLVRAGGVLVYSTCSLEPEENERVAEHLVGLHPEFRLETTRSLFPPRDGTDGGFIARWQRS